MARPSLRASHLAPVVLMGAILFASHWEVPPMLPEISWSAPDKWLHFLVFGLLGTLWTRSFRAVEGPWRAAFHGWLVATAFGAVDELVQAFNPVRFFDPADFAADAAGALVAVLAYTLWPAYRRVLEWRLLPRRAPADPSSLSTRPAAS